MHIFGGSCFTGGLASPEQAPQAKTSVSAASQGVEQNGFGVAQALIDARLNSMQRARLARGPAGAEPN